MKTKFRKIHLFIVVLITAVGVGDYLGYQNYQLNNNKSALEKELRQTQDYFSRTALELVNTRIQRNDFEQKYIGEKIRMDSLSSQISYIQGTVGILEKLSQTDPELLKKYSKVYFLNENYIPETFTKIDPKYTLDPQKDYLIYSKIWQFLENLLIAAENDKIDIKIISAYRSFGTQSELKSSYKIIYGSGANQFSSDQGYSEHQLGTTLDFTTSKVGATFSGFDKTTTYQWLLDNAYKYGFILSYPKGNEYYQFEPWHWRFVGKGLAEKLHQDAKSFYDLDQRDIDQYLISFFDYLPINLEARPTLK